MLMYFSTRLICINDLKRLLSMALSVLERGETGNKTFHS